MLYYHHVYCSGSCDYDFVEARGRACFVGVVSEKHLGMGPSTCSADVLDGHHREMREVTRS